MSHFTEKELEYLGTQRLGRLATVNAKGQPQNAPVGFRYNADLDVIEIGGRYMSKTQKLRNIQRDPHVSFVIDDVLPPWKPRGIEIRGIAEVIPDGGQTFFGTSYAADPVYIRIKPTKIIGWGIEAEGYEPLKRTVEQS